MSDEIKKEEHCNCICHSKAFRKFLTIAGGTFVGVFCALSLFAALHKPPMPIPCPCQQQYMMMRPDFGPHHYRGPHRGDFHKKMIKDMAERKAPVQNQDKAPFQRDI